MDISTGFQLSKCLLGHEQKILKVRNIIFKIRISISVIVQAPLLRCWPRLKILGNVDVSIPSLNPYSTRGGQKVVFYKKEGSAATFLLSRFSSIHFFLAAEYSVLEGVILLSSLFFSPEPFLLAPALAFAFGFGFEPALAFGVEPALAFGCGFGAALADLASAASKRCEWGFMGLTSAESVCLTTSSESK